MSTLLDLVDPLDGRLHFTTYADARLKASSLTIGTGLAWMVQYHPDTARWHVVVPSEQLHHVTPAASHLY